MSYIRFGGKSHAYAWLDVDNSIHIWVSPKEAKKRGLPVDDCGMGFIRLSKFEMKEMCKNYLEKP